MTDRDNNPQSRLLIASHEISETLERHGCGARDGAILLTTCLACLLAESIKPDDFEAHADEWQQTLRASYYEWLRRFASPRSAQ